MSNTVLEAETRQDKGRGASRRLRRVENKIPAILYGGDKPTQMLHLLHHKVVKALEVESIYSSVFEMKVDGKTERVILKDLQRHPYKPLILHMDLQRVSAKDVLVRMVPLHFINEEASLGVKEGGMVNHNMMQVEVRCQAQYLPEYIEVDLASMAIDDVIHLSSLKLPQGVKLAVDPTEGGHDHPVVSVHLPKVTLVEEVEEPVEGEEVEATKEGASESSEQVEPPEEN